MFKVGDRIFCIKAFVTTSFNKGKKTELIPGLIYTVRALNKYGHLLLEEVRSMDNGGKHEAGFGNDNEFFVSLDDILKED